MMKKIPNIISISRIVCALLLLLVTPLSLPFFFLYLIGGLSDIVDGFIARKLKLESKLGALLDSIADFILIAVLLIIFIPIISWPEWALVWIAAIVFIRLASLAISFSKYHTFAFLHTYANKASGLTLFCFPLLYSSLGLKITTILLCSLTTLSAIEELTITIRSKTLNRNITSIFSAQFISEK